MASKALSEFQSQTEEFCHCWYDGIADTTHLPVTAKAFPAVIGDWQMGTIEDMSGVTTSRLGGLVSIQCGLLKCLEGPSKIKE